MKHIKMVQIVVLFCMFFNISHASLVALAESCEHEHTELMHVEVEHAEVDDCDDLCDIHHLFHFSAILINQNVSIDNFSKNLQPMTKHIAFHPFIKETTIKPPIV